MLFEPSQLLIWRGCDLIGLGKPMFTSRAAIFTLELTKTTCCIIMPHHERVFPSVSSMHRQLRPVPYWRFDYYSAPKGERSTVMIVSVCLRVSVGVCPQSYLRNYTSDRHQISVHVTYGRGSVLLWRRSDTLCTSGLWMTSCLHISQGGSTSPPS